MVFLRLRKPKSKKKLSHDEEESYQLLKGYLLDQGEACDRPKRVTRKSGTHFLVELCVGKFGEHYRSRTYIVIRNGQDHVIERIDGS